MQAFSAQVRSYVTGVQDYDEEFAKALEEGDDFWGGVLDALQTGLDLAGLIPGIGEAFDLANAGIYTLRGDAVNAGLSLLACVPIGGQAATAAKLGKKVIGKVAKEVTGEGVEKVVREGAEILVKNADEIAQAGAKGAGDVIEGGLKTISRADKAKISKWNYTPSDEVYLKHKDVFDNSKYYNQQTGEINWPLNDGFKNTPIEEALKPGTQIDRYGSDFGSFASPKGTPYEMRSAAPGTELKPYSVFEVVEPIKVKTGEIASWFDAPGGGTQYLLPKSVDDLLDAGVLRRVE